MPTNANVRTESADSLQPTVDRAVRRIPPLWPLAASVAVNPFLGHAGERLAETGAILARVGGAPITMPRSWYLERIAAGQISDADLAAALAASPYAERPGSLEGLKAAAARPAQGCPPLPTVADLAGDADAIDWAGLIAERVGAWAGGYFDEGQALWSAPKGKCAWSAYRAHATHDLTPEIIGLNGFAAFVADAPERAGEAIARAAETLGLNGEALELYCHRLLMSLGGWAQFARYRLWRAELAGATDRTAVDLLAIRLLWEEALLCLRSPKVENAWAAAKPEYAKPVRPDAALVIDEILQEAAERAAQRALETSLAAPTSEQGNDRPSLQAAFCIDVRSEVFRRALESVDPSIRTLGFAGFFGVFAKHRQFASDVEELRLPVLLNPTVSSCATTPETKDADAKARYAARGKRAWGRFKLAAVSSFAFVEATGPVYIAKLLRDGLGLHGGAASPDPQPRFDPELDLEARVNAAETVLLAMSLTDGFARLALLVGHGANVVNNPHESSLHCGACGGYSGEVNARLLASLLNDLDVRKGLVARGIRVPDDTVFVAALHDTTTDQVMLYDQDVQANSHRKDIEQARRRLASAGKRARSERALRLPRAKDERDVAARARNWAEVRPEWGLAGCRAFIAAPRSRTTGRNLEGAAFLHDYDWKPDSANGFKVLELIMTAPVVVASWISLQYYGSTVAPKVFGAGDKVLHNVVGGIGVFEGNGGVLRAGLPWQSVHDGERFVHDPLRLSVCIEAPREAMTDILRRHDEVRALFDNRWLHLFALDEAGRMAWRYSGGLEWEATESQPAEDLLIKAAS